MATARSAAEVTEALSASFAARADAERATGMSSYMRDQFEFLGLSSADRRAAQRPVLAPLRDAGEEELIEVARSLWALPEREFAYAAVDLLRANARRLTPSSLGPLRELVQTRSWWDTVDSLAKVVGDVVRRHPETVPEMDRWARDDDIWVARVALLHQLGWKSAADPERLFGYCTSLASHPDFFIRKGIGWALRDLARSYPDEVRAYVAEHAGELSGLSVREATKHL